MIDVPTGAGDAPVVEAPTTGDTPESQADIRASAQAEADEAVKKYATDRKKEKADAKGKPKKQTIEEYVSGLENVPEDDAGLLELLRGHPDLAKSSDDDLLDGWHGPRFEKGDHFSFLGADGEEIGDIDPSISRWLQGTQVRYKALGKTHDRSFNDVIRTAIRGHLNSQQEERYKSDIAVLNDKLKTSSEEIAPYRERESMWNDILTAAMQGNTDPFIHAVKIFQQQMLGGGKPQNQEAAALQAQIEKMESDKHGEQVWQQEVVPYVAELATKYGLEAGELEQEVYDLVNAVPEHLMSADYFENMLVNYIPNMLELRALEAGAPEGTEGATTPTTAAPEENVELKALRAELENLKNKQAAEAADSGPPPSGSGPTSGLSGDDLPEFESWAQARRYLKGERK